MMSRSRLLLALAVAAAGGLPGGAAQVPDARELMWKVAWNQGRAQEARRQFRYRQRVVIRFHGTRNRLLREEISEFFVEPGPRTIRKQRIRFSGRYRRRGRMIFYFQPNYQDQDLDIDGDLISDLAEALTSDPDARDGISRELFPLTLQRVRGMDFGIARRVLYGGNDVYRVVFHPKGDWTDGASPWAGEALIDIDELQPVLVTTHLAKEVPLWVEAVFGTNIRHLGFKVVYRRFEDGLWFPVRYGGEFALRALWFYRRKISIALQNTAFERADVSSRIQYRGPVQGTALPSEADLPEAGLPERCH